MIRCVFTAWVLLCVVGSAAVVAGDGRSAHVYRYRQADRALAIARRACKPLVIHVVADSRKSSDQIKAFYHDRKGIPPVVLDRVVVLILPQEKFPAFARQLGIRSAGGMRTISPYDLSVLGSEAKATQKATHTYRTRLVCKPGFR